MFRRRGSSRMRCLERSPRSAASGIGDPHSGDIYTLNSVAAVVLGGVSLLGGVGGLLGVMAAAFVLTLVKKILIIKGVDQNYAQVIQGSLIVLVVMITGGVDLSCATAATASAFMISSFARDGTVVAILVALGVGLGIGLVNGTGVAIFRVNALIMTLGVSTVTLGALTVYSQKRFLAAAPDFVVRLGSERFLTYIPYDLLVWAPIAALIILGLRYSGIGRMIYAVGDNPVASRLGGVRVWQVLLFVYAMCGLLSAAAGILLVGFNNAADLGIGTPFLLPSVAAVGIGGTSIFGGLGAYGGTILGALILTVLDSLLTIVNASQAVRQVIYGLIVLALAAIYARATAASE